MFSESFAQATYRCVQCAEGDEVAQDIRGKINATL